MLPKEHRLRKKKDFDRVFKRGRGIKSDFFIFKITENQEGKPRFGFIVSQKISKKAVVRNKVKRRFREAVQKILLEKQTILEKGLDVVLIALPGIEEKDFSDLKEKINEVMIKTRLFHL